MTYYFLIACTNHFILAMLIYTYRQFNILIILVTPQTYKQFPSVVLTVPYTLNSKHIDLKLFQIYMK